MCHCPWPLFALHDIQKFDLTVAAVVMQRCVVSSFIFHVVYIYIYKYNDSVTYYNNVIMIYGNNDEPRQQ